MRKIICPEIKLNNGVMLPQIGFGLAMIAPDQLQSVVDTAISSGYRLFDSSPLYGNEKEFGEAIKQNGVSREDIFISSKLRNSQQKYDDAIKSFHQTRKTLGVDYLDLYMIYWPCPAYDRYCEAWKALEHLYEEGYVRAIGVSNFLPEHIEKLLSCSNIVPAVNELECNPYLSIAPLRKYCKEKNIHIESWFPLGGPAKKLGGNVSTGPRLLADKLIVSLAEKYKKSPAQIVLRWAVQSDITPLPKSSNPSRIFDNINIFDFVLTAEDMYELDLLNCDLRNGHDPATTNDQF